MHGGLADSWARAVRKPVLGGFKLPAVPLGLNWAVRPLAGQSQGLLLPQAGAQNDRLDRA